ncbi:TLDc [Kalmanozyma brasiliensis GHG001]|uniref:TLDc n=1 Tax=Kalmanozyma brasiliensis (strain GHG001) TaxID=1365824 RepID=UPI002867EC1D|nr:TLDc [Kalmanozyma brasiliensis GHG001]EST06667.2 TLDc [Kalmanozyma brasiliensis GHG001]
MASPESSLRRRGGGSVSEPSGHAKAESDGFGSFVDSSSAFPSDFDQELSEPLDGRASSSAVQVGSPTNSRAGPSSLPPHRIDDEDAEDWTEADMVAGFSPAEYHFASSDATTVAAAQAAQPTSTSPSTVSRPMAGRKVSGTGASSEWADWSSFLAAHTLPTQQQQPSSSSKAPTGQALNPADDAFFDAFEVATNPNRGPSPPVIDLRGVEKRLEQRKQQQQQKDASDTANDDFFSRFERAPQAALGKSSPLVLEPDQLESMHDARISPMPRSPSKRNDSYFGLTAPKPISSNNATDPQSRSAEQKRESGSSSFSPASPSSWTGSIRKTWTTLRGIQSEIASHLPSASDFIVPEDEAEQGGSSSKHGAADSNPGGGLIIASDAPEQPGDSQNRAGVRRRSSGSNRRGTLPHAWDYSQETPFGSSSGATSSGFSAGAAAPSSGSSSTAPLRARDLFAPAAGSASTSSASSSGTLRRAPIHSSTAPISGAPGFDTTSTRKWNTGQWTLDEKEKRAIPVTLSNRRDETESVIEPFHASRLQALLPPRLQLGKRWSLLYSLDQHGISLQTLYHRVSSGLDPTKIKRSVSDTVTGNTDTDEAAEGWLRGASRETQQAMGTRSSRMHVGGGLSSISDAGLIIALKDEGDNVFGAFVNEKLRPQQHYYGSGECFLWKTTVGKGGEEGGVEQYKWTGRNDYMVLSESTFLSVGGGEGKFGLWVDGNLEKGVSSCCPAFDNEILCDGKARGEGRKEGEGRFECYGLEVWAVGID